MQGFLPWIANLLSSWRSNRLLVVLLVSFLTAVVSSAAPAVGAEDLEWILDGACGSWLKAEPSGAAQALSALEPLFHRAREVIRSQDPASRLIVARDLVTAQSKGLRARGVLHRVSGDSRWLDILPDPGGASINRYAARIQKETAEKAILRYAPELLLSDAYSVLTAGSSRAVIYLSHLDLVRSPSSRFFTRQATLFRMSEQIFLKQSLRDPEGMKGFARPAPRDADYSIDYLRQNKLIPSFGDEPAIPEALHRYFTRSEEWNLLLDQVDPISVRFGPQSRMFVEGLQDVSGLRLVRNEFGELRDAEIFDPQGLKSEAELKRFALDMFLEESDQDERIRRYQPESYRARVSRRISLPGGRTLHQLSGDAAPDTIFETYLEFLFRIYRSYRDLGLPEGMLEQIRSGTLAMKQNSQIVFWSRNRNFLKKPDSREVLSGLIFVVSENADQRLPLEWIRRLPAGALRETEDEILVEVGRLGSEDDPSETIRLLRVAGMDLYNRYGRYFETGSRVRGGKRKKIRLVCEGNALRERYFRRFGFQRVEAGIEEVPYYKDGGDHLLEVDLETFLLAVMN